MDDHDEEHEAWLAQQNKKPITLPPNLPAGSVTLGGDFTDLSHVRSTDEADKKKKMGNPKKQGTVKGQKPPRFGRKS